MTAGQLAESPMSNENSMECEKCTDITLQLALFIYSLRNISNLYMFKKKNDNNNNNLDAYNGHVEHFKVYIYAVI